MVPESPRNGRHNKIAITVIFQEEQEEQQSRLLKESKQPTGLTSHLKSIMQVLLGLHTHFTTGTVPCACFCCF